MKPKLKPPGTKRLKLKCDILLSTSAFNFNLRRYTVEWQSVDLSLAVENTLQTMDGRGVHPSTLQLNLSRFWSLKPPQGPTSQLSLRRFRPRTLPI